VESSPVVSSLSQHFQFGLIAAHALPLIGHVPFLWHSQFSAHLKSFVPWLGRIYERGKKVNTAVNKNTAMTSENARSQLRGECAQTPFGSGRIVNCDIDTFSCRTKQNVKARLGIYFMAFFVRRVIQWENADASPD